MLYTLHCKKVLQTISKILHLHSSKMRRNKKEDVQTLWQNVTSKVLATTVFILVANPLGVVEKAHHLEINYYVNFLGRLGSNGFQLKWRFGTRCNWKNQNPGDRFEATS